MELEHSRRCMSVADYLRMERASDVRREYVDGAARVMPPETLRHSAVSANVGSALSLALCGRRCVVFQCAARIHVPAARMYTYADATVVCGPVQIDARMPTR